MSFLVVSAEEQPSRLQKEIIKARNKVLCRAEECIRKYVIDTIWPQGIHLFTFRWCNECREQEITPLKHRNVEKKVGQGGVDLQDISLIYFVKPDDENYDLLEYIGLKDWKTMLEAYTEHVGQDLKIFRHDPTETVHFLEIY